MSQIISPSTGRLITVGSDEFNELISSPRWSSHFTSPLTPISLGTVRPMTVAPNSPSRSLPSLPLLSSVPVSTPMFSSSLLSNKMPLQTMTPISSLPSLSGYSMPSLTTTKTVLGSRNWTKSANSTLTVSPPISISSMTTLPPLPTPPSSLPPLPNSPPGSLHSLPRPTSVPISTPISINSMTYLPPLPNSPTTYRTISLTGNSMATLPPVPNSPTTYRTISLAGASMATLPPLPNSPTTYRTISLAGKSMAVLPPVPLSPAKTKSASASYQTLPLSGKSMAVLPPVPLSPAKTKSASASYQTLPLSGNSMAVLPPVPLSPAAKSKSPDKSVSRQEMALSGSSMAYLLPVPASPARSKPSSSGNAYNIQTVLIPPGSPMASLPPVPQSPFDLPTYDIPSLEEVLTKTKQHHLRKRLEEMIAEKRAEEGRGSKTRGWKARAPQKGRPRHELKDKCGNACFLDPQNEAYPICPTPELGVGCKIDCGGLQSAKVRASQYHKPEIAALADKLLKEKCPILSSFTPKYK